MSDEQINIAIAEACGWGFSETAVSYPNGLKIQFHPPEYVKEVFLKEIPDYCNDLNAMHEAEQTKEMLWNSDYSWWLGRVCTTQRGFDPDKQEEIEQMKIGQFATARQRAEAFLRTIGKWEEAK